MTLPIRDYYPILESKPLTEELEELQTSAPAPSSDYRRSTLASISQGEDFRRTKSKKRSKYSTPSTLKQSRLPRELFPKKKVIIGGSDYEAEIEKIDKERLVKSDKF